MRLARAVGYVGVGTVEFLVAGDGYFFLEMNPRLQVEHGITEEITGLDLVELQIRIARGETLADADAPREHGCGIEARVCAEDPDAGFLPAPGRIARFDPALGPRVRIDTGVVAGSVVPAGVRLADRQGDRERRHARGSARAPGLRARRLRPGDRGRRDQQGLPARRARDADYRRGGVDTEWLDRYAATGARGAAYAVEALIAAAILAYQRARVGARGSTSSPTRPTSRRRACRRRTGQQIDLDATAARAIG